MEQIKNQHQPVCIYNSKLNYHLVFFSKATGSQLGTLIEISVGILMSLIIAFAYSWVLSLLVLGVVPFVVITVFLQAKALSGYANKRARHQRSLERYENGHFLNKLQTTLSA